MNSLTFDIIPNGHTLFTMSLSASDNIPDITFESLKDGDSVGLKYKDVEIDVCDIQINKEQIVGIIDSINDNTINLRVGSEVSFKRENIFSCCRRR